MPDKASSNRSALHVAVISFAGRLLTFAGRTMYIARFGGAHPLLNAFAYALHVPQVLFNVIGTALSTVFIPVYNTLLAEEKHGEAKKFIDNVISISIVFLLALTAVGITAAPWLSRWIGGAGYGEGGYLTFSLRFLMPAMVFFGFGAVFTGLLQSHGKFRLPALVSLPGGVFLILYIVFLSDRFGVTGLLVATLLGAAMQPLIMIPAVGRLGYRYSFSFDLKNENIHAAGRLCVPVLVSVASYQAHFLFAHSRALRMGYAAVMDYAQQLVQVFIMIIVLAVAAVYFPKLSALWAAKKTGEYNENLKNAFVYTIFLVLPAACGIMLLRFEIMELLLNFRGRGDTQTAGNLMGLYAAGIIATAVREIADRGFYAMRDSKTPAVFGVVIMGINIGAVLLLIPHMGVYAMPAAYTLAAFCGVTGLLARLYGRTPFADRFMLWEAGKILAAVIIMAAVVLFVKTLPLDNRLLAAAVPAAAGGAVYFLTAHLFRVKAMKERIK